MENTYQNERKVKRDGSWQQHSISNSYESYSVCFALLISLKDLIWFWLMEMVYIMYVQ